MSNMRNYNMIIIFYLNITSIYHDFILFHILKLCRNKNIRGVPIRFHSLMPSNMLRHIADLNIFTPTEHEPKVKV